MAAIRYMIHHRLKSSTEVETLAIPSEAHLDEDAIGAFVEGQLGESESGSVISHLIACGSCRANSARLIHLESQIVAEDDSTIPEESPSRLRQFLEGLASQVIPRSNEDVVFAYQNPPEDTDEVKKVAAESTPDKPKQTDSSTEPESK